MEPVKMDMLLRFAAKYIWWTSPEEAVSRPDRIVAQVMNLGDYGDVQILANEVDNAYLAQVLQKSEAGEFNERSWTYWHYRLGLCKPGEVPALPQRRIA